MRPFDRLLLKLLPSRLSYADRLTFSGKRVLKRMGIGVFGVFLGVAAVWLLEPNSWREILAGALLAWSVSVFIWAPASYHTAQQALRAALRRQAELDLLHARINQISARVGAPILDLDADIEPAVVARMERLAHFGSLDEFRLETTVPPNYAFWSEEALGRHGGTSSNSGS
jgi:hypothetical protein